MCKAIDVGCEASARMCLRQKMDWACACVDREALQERPVDGEVLKDMNVRPLRVNEKADEVCVEPRRHPR